MTAVSGARQVEFQRSFYDQHFVKRTDVTRQQLAHPMFRSFYDRLAADILARAWPDAGRLRLLECGCGEGLLSSALQRTAARRGIPMDYTGTDLSAPALELAKEHVEGDLVAGDAVEVLAGLDASSRDVVVMKNLLHHLSAPSALLAQAARVVGPAGRVVVVEPRLARPDFWVFNVLALRREWRYFGGARRNVSAFAAAGLQVRDHWVYSMFPYELMFAVRFDWFRRRFSTADEGELERAANVDDRLTRAVPALAAYNVWVTSPAGADGR